MTGGLHPTFRGFLRFRRCGSGSTLLTGRPQLVIFPHLTPLINRVVHNVQPKLGEKNESHLVIDVIFQRETEPRDSGIVVVAQAPSELLWVRGQLSPQRLRPQGKFLISECVSSSLSHCSLPATQGVCCKN